MAERSILCRGHFMTSHGLGLFRLISNATACGIQSVSGDQGRGDHPGDGDDRDRLIGAARGHPGRLRVAGPDLYAPGIGRILAIQLHGNRWSIMLVAGLAFFYLVATRLNQSVAITLALQAEKDALIAELETANAMSDEGRRRAEEANLAKSRFLASMSHELRTPLNAILGFSEVMAKEVLGPIQNGTYREYASDIHASGEHLLNLINEDTRSEPDRGRTIFDQ